MKKVSSAVKVYPRWRGEYTDFVLHHNYNTNFLACQEENSRKGDDFTKNYREYRTTCSFLGVTQIQILDIINKKFDLGANQVKLSRGVSGKSHYGNDDEVAAAAYGVAFGKLLDIENKVCDEFGIDGNNYDEVIFGIDGIATLIVDGRVAGKYDVWNERKV